MKNRIVYSFLAAIFLTAFNSCIQMPQQFQGPPPGKWRAVLKLVDVRRPLNKDAKPKDGEKFQFAEVTDGELPFNFDFEYDENFKKLKMTIYNGDERIVVKEKDIEWGWEKGTGNDTITIDFPHYDSYIKALFEEDVIEGAWYVKTKENYSIPFLAKQGKGHRFTTLKKEPVMDVSGEWEVTFDVNTDNPYKAIGEFRQDGNHLTGTFRTETGDYRFLEGTIQANKMYLSCFDGSHAFLFEAKILEDKTMIGSFRSGTHYQSTWSAKRNPDFKLKDASTLTYLKNKDDKFTFAFPDTEGKTISLEDKKYQGKAKIVQILGTWCPNCADETEFLTEYLKNNPNLNLEVIGLAFEKHKTTDKANTAINTFKERFGVDYEVLWAGSSSKKKAAEALPMLNAIISYPTMIFLDKNNSVTYIHTGFSGPATSKYEGFKKDFDERVKQLVKEGN